MRNNPAFFFLLLPLFFSTSVISCAQQQNQAELRSEFYKGLTSTDTKAAIAHFEKALVNNNKYIRRAAAQELAALMAGGEKLSSRTEQRMRQEAHGPWASALEAAGASVPDKEKSLAFLLNIDHTVPEEARAYVLNKNAGLFTKQELAAINGHFNIFSLRYNEALASFRSFQENREWPVFMPDMFLKYPAIINDLGRAFQYSSSRLEGMDLFLQWEKNLITADSYSSLMEARFRLLFFAARIARRNGRNEEAQSIFEKSLLIAPTAEQEDACIWYILDLSLNKEADVFIQKLEHYIKQWHNGNYYNDLLEKFLQTLCEKQDWDNLIRTYYIIRNSASSKKAGYAWIISRIIDEGYKTNLKLADKRVYLNAAYNEGCRDMSSALYYRSLSAAVLRKPLFVFTGSSARRSRERAVNSSSQAAEAVQFISEFIANNAEEHMLRYALQLEKELSIDELRAVAGVLNEAGMFVQAIRLVTRYMNREDYSVLVRRDLELLFPRPYNDLINKHAKEADIAPEILYGLIRTESAFQETVVSRSGAVGLTQLMPATARDMANRMRRAGGPDFSGDNLNLDDPGQNILIGAFYLNYLINRFDDMLLSLMAYNGGMNRVRRLREASSLPTDLFMETVAISETRDYSRKVIGASAVYKALYY